jgi:hypothetical protein
MRLQLSSRRRLTIMGKKTVAWTDEQRAESARQYERIGYKPGELWPAPPEHLSAAQILDLMRRVPDGAGLAGWRAVLAASK